MRIFGGAILIVLMLAGAANAANIIYNVGVPLFNGGGIYGDIVTDGTTGPLSTGDIVGWDLFLFNGTDGPEELTQANSNESVGGSSLTATLSGLFFNFDGPGGDGLFFGSNSDNGEACFATGDGCEDFSVLVLADGDNDNFAYLYLTGNDQIGSAPEPSGMVLLGGGAALLVLRKRRALSRYRSNPARRKSAA